MKASSPIPVLLDQRRVVLGGSGLPALRPNDALRLAEHLTIAAMRAKAVARGRGGRGAALLRGKLA